MALPCIAIALGGLAEVSWRRCFVDAKLNVCRSAAQTVDFDSMLDISEIIASTVGDKRPFVGAAGGPTGGPLQGMPHNSAGENDG